MIENKEYLGGYSSFKYPIKGPLGRPLTTTDDIAVKIIVDEDDDYEGFESLTERLQQLENTVQNLYKIILGETDTTEAIDTFKEVVDFLSEHKNTEVLGNIPDLETEEISENKYEDVFN